MELEKYDLGCGCKVDLYNSTIKKCDSLPSIGIDFYNLRNCSKSWPLLHQGKTKGIFQLEKGLGQQWAAKIEPWNIEELAALVSLIRPGVLEAIVDGKNMTQHYADRKKGLEPATPLHPALYDLLKDTYQVLTYQEQAIRISQEIAGYDGAAADTLRKVIGKKQIEEMTKERSKFIDGAVRVGKVDEKQATEIFDIIENGQRYLFNLSHAQSYGSISYWCAWAKSHFPLHFFCSYLKFSNNNPNSKLEVKELMNDAKYFNINVLPPKLNSGFLENQGSFYLYNNDIHFGLSNIKGLGESHIHKLHNKVLLLVEKLGSIESWPWFTFLVNMNEETSSTVMNNLVLVGATPDYKVSRKRKLFELKQYNELSDREREWIRNSYKSYQDLKSALQEYILIPRKSGGPATEKRIDTIKQIIKALQNPSYNLQDEPEWVVANERSLLGTSISYSALQSKNIATNFSCSDFLLGRKEKPSIACEIIRLKETTIKNGNDRGKKMAFITIADDTASLECVAFAGIYEKNKDVLFEGNTIVVGGFPSKKNDKVLNITSVEQL